MKYGIKKLMALLMALLMVLNMAPISSFAEEGENKNEVDPSAKEDIVLEPKAEPGKKMGATRSVPVYTDPGANYDVTITGFDGLTGQYYIAVPTKAASGEDEQDTNDENAWTNTEYHAVKIIGNGVYKIRTTDVTLETQDGPGFVVLKAESAEMAATKTGGEGIVSNTSIIAPSTAVITDGEKNYSVSIDKGSSECTIAFKEAETERNVVVNIYDRDGVTPYSQEIPGPWKVKVTAEDDNGDKYYAVKTIEISNKTTASVKITHFQKPLNDYDYLQETQDDKALYDGLVIKDVRLVKGDWISWNSITNNTLQDAIEGLEIVSNDFEGNTNTISIKRPNEKRYAVRFLFDSNNPTIKDSDQAYLFGVVNHQTTGTSYFLRKIKSSDYSVSTDTNGHKYFDVVISQWQDQNGNNEYVQGSNPQIPVVYTGNESSITVYLFKGDGTDLNMTNIRSALSDPTSNTNCARITENGVIGTYGVHYGEYAVIHDNTNFIDNGISYIDFESKTASNDYTIASVLGSGINYGITADRLQQGSSDFQSTFAVNHYQDHGNGVNPNLSGTSAGEIAIGDYVKYKNDRGTEWDVIPDGKFDFGSTYNHAQAVVYTDSKDRIKDPSDLAENGGDVHVILTTAAEVKAGLYLLLSNICRICLTSY